MESCWSRAKSMRATVVKPVGRRAYWSFIDLFYHRRATCSRIDIGMHYEPLLNPVYDGYNGNWAIIRRRLRSVDLRNKANNHSLPSSWEPERLID